MKTAHRYLLATCFACLLPFSLFAEAPVVDDSENFALLDEQQAAVERPVYHNRKNNDSYYEDDASEQPALAHESASNSDNQTAGFLNKIQGLQQDIQELRGQLEVQTHELATLKQQQLDFYKDLDTRLRQDPVKTAKNQAPTDMAVNPTPTAPNNPASPATTPVIKTMAEPIPTTPHGNPANEQISYLSAYELVKNKQYDEALSALQAFVIQYPQGGYTANAQYWLGEVYMVKTNYAEAITHFDTVLQQFPSSSKSSASLLKIGYALAASGKKEDARTRLLQVVKTYPDTHTAQLAAAKLRTLDAG